MVTPASCLLVPGHKKLKVPGGKCELEFSGTFAITPCWKYVLFENQDLKTLKAQSCGDRNTPMELMVSGATPSCTPWFLHLSVLPIGTQHHIDC